MLNFRNKTVVITGATGLIGYNLAVKLLQTSIDKVVVTGRNREKLYITFKNYLSDSRLIIKEYDAVSPLPLDIGVVDYIFHAAGPIERDIVINKPVSVLFPNIFGIIHCLECLKKQEEETGKKGRLIVFSSVTVYNSDKNDYVAIESDTTQAISLDQPYASYAESKRMIEVIAHSYHRQFGVDVVIARFSTVYGYTPNVPDSAFYEFVKKSMRGEDIVVNSSAAPKRDNIYVEDAINGLLLITLSGESSAAYNVSSGGAKGNYAAVDEIAETAARVTGKGSKVIYKVKDVPKKGGMILDNSKLKSLGWSIKYSLDEGISETMNKYNQNLNLIRHW